MANALKKITTRAKQLRKKSPGKSWKTVVKQAGAEYRAGKLKKRKKPAKRRSVTRKKKAVRRKAAPRRRRVSSAVGARRVVRRRRKRAAAKPRVVIRTRTKTVRISGRRRVSGKKSLMPIIAIAAVGFAAYMLLKPKPAPVIITTGNLTRDTQAQNVLMYAQAAGATATAIANLIAQINKANQSGAALPDNSAVQSIISQYNPGAGNIGARMIMR